MAARSIASPGIQTPGESPKTTAAPSQAGSIGCSLPVFNWGWVTNGPTTSVVGQNGFLAVDSGRFTADPTGVFSEDSTGRFASQQTPVLYGDNFTSATYDPAYRRWLPAPPSHVLADGSAYVYELELPDGSAYEIHLVEVASATDRMISHMPYDNAYSVIAFQPAGVYVEPILHRSGLPTGVWLLDPKTRSLTAYPNSMNSTWQTVAGGGVWGGPGGQAGDSLTRLDLSTGLVPIWFQHAVQGAEFEGFGYGVSLIGFDRSFIGFDRSFRPVVEVFPPGPAPNAPQQSPGAPQVWIVRAPGDASELSGIALARDHALSFGVSDPLGLWLAGADGIYVYTDSGFQRIAPLAPSPTPNYTIEGACV